MWEHLASETGADLPGWEWALGATVPSGWMVVGADRAVWGGHHGGGRAGGGAPQGAAEHFEPVQS